MRDTPALPAGAWDCHTHVIGARTDYPMVAQRHYTPGPASLEDLFAHLSRHGLQRVVIVQPSIYGTDNRCMLDSLDRLQGAGRGVAVLDEDVDNEALRAMRARGVRGLRLNLESSGLCDAGAAQAELARWAGRIAMFDWHLQLYADLDVILAMAGQLAKLPVPVVLDHFAMVPTTLAHDDARAIALLTLLRSGNVYIKFSAPYRLASAGMPPDDAASAWAALFLRTAPRHVLWGSDWPHTARDPRRSRHEVSAYRTLPEGALARSIRNWLPTQELRQQVLVENPARLYAP